MKRGLLVLGFLFAIFLAGSISAACTLDATLLNQDPYPAIPGEELRLVFQLTGISNPSCGEISFELKDHYPLDLFDQRQSSKNINSGTYLSDYKSHWIIPYRLKVDENALDGSHNITVSYSASEKFTISKDFEIEVNNPLSEFEINFKEYDFQTKKATIEIINLGENDVEALTVEIPKQEKALTYGSNKIILGTIDSNEDDIITFDVDLEEGMVNFVINYNDPNNIRREYKTSAYFDKDLFSRQVKTSSSPSSTATFFYGVVITLIIIFGYLWYKKKKLKNKNLKHNH